MPDELLVYSEDTRCYWNDTDMSWAEKGLLSLLLWLGEESADTDIPVEFGGESFLIQASSGGVAQLRRLVKELVDAGYLTKERIYRKGVRGVQATRWTVYASSEVEVGDE